MVEILTSGNMDQGDESLILGQIHKGNAKA